MQALVRVGLPEKSETFADLRKQLAGRMAAEYGGRIPDRYLTVPYGGGTHQELFAMLLGRFQRQ
jgi:hypothetical protein